MGFWTSLKQQIREIAYIHDDVDVEEAAEKIKGNIWFRGPNVWILAFSIVIASVGLNINSTAVIIGAMLISPLMGPIIGIGLALGTNDWQLLKNAAKNLLIMVIISLLASCLFFLVSPLQLVNPTELESRTNPTIYDVLIALFGGLAGIMESCRKEKGTVLSGVAIATALMPPLCTAGYGLANASMHYFSGASFLFLINCVFIILATYVMVKYLHFKEVKYANIKIQKRTRTIVTVIIVLVIIPSFFSAVRVIRDNNFETNVQQFISANKLVGKAYIYDYRIYSGKNRSANIYLAGEGLSEAEMEELLESAEVYGISRDQLNITENALGDRQEETDKLLASIYDRTDTEISRKNARIKELEAELESQKQDAIPYSQIVREIRFNYPDVQNVTIARGAMVDDSLRVNNCISVVAETSVPMEQASIESLQEWARIRLDDSTAVVSNIVKTHTEF